MSPAAPNVSRRSASVMLYARLPTKSLLPISIDSLSLTVVHGLQRSRKSRTITRTTEMTGRDEKGPGYHTPVDRHCPPARARRIPDFRDVAHGPAGTGAARDLVIKS